MSEKTLQTSKKRLSNGKWSYRNYIVVKDGEWRVEEKDYFGDTQSEKIKQIEGQKTIKDICLKIDEILGDLPESAKKKVTKKKKPIKQEEIDETVAEAKKIAYEVRWQLEEELQKENKEEELQGKLAIPLGQGKVSGKNGFIISWNKTFTILEDIILKTKENYSNADFKVSKKEDKTELEVKITKQDDI